MELVSLSADAGMGDCAVRQRRKDAAFFKIIAGLFVHVQSIIRVQTYHGESLFRQISVVAIPFSGWIASSLRMLVDVKAKQTCMRHLVRWHLHQRPLLMEGTTSAIVMFL